jgi:hypothetical protein
MALGGILAVIKANKRFLNPLTKSLARPPGTQLGRELGREQIETGFGILEIVFPSLVPILVYAQTKEKILSGEPLAVGLLMVVLIGWAIWVGYSTWKLLKRFDRIRVLRLAYECELAVGQELDLLMLNGFRVFHDIPAGNFNIDHIVVGECGVFAVETKGRSKRLNGPEEGKKGYQVIYEGGVLKFPGWRDKESPEQASRQAKWASKWLSDATGLKVPVRPVVVLPGWYIENKDRPVVPVIASGYIQKYFQSQHQGLFDQQQVQQIVYQIDQKVRDIAPGEIARPLPEAN